MLNPKIYYRPKTLAEVYAHLNESDSVALAGGALTLSGLEAPFSRVVDVQDVPELQQQERRAEAIRIGGGVAVQTVMEDEALPLAFRPSIARTVPLNQRYRLSIMESLTHPNAPSEWWAMLAVASAQVEHSGFQKGVIGAKIEMASVVDFINAVYRHGYPYTGLVQALWLPIPTANQRFGSAYVARTPSDIPIVNAAASVTIAPDNTVVYAALAVNGATQDPLYFTELNALKGRIVTIPEMIETVQSIAEALNPPQDYRGSALYRREMALVMARRALLACITG